MGGRNDKLAASDESISGEIVDISARVSDSQEDIDDNRFRIVITCRGDHVIRKKDTVDITISGDEDRHLCVVVRNKQYYNSQLPRSASACEYKIEEKKKNASLLYLMVTKTEPGYWLGKQKKR